jgi:hypothetical protein
VEPGEDVGWVGQRLARKVVEGGSDIPSLEFVQGEWARIEMAIFIGRI